MAYTPEQRKVIRTVKRVARRRGASPKVTKSALETILVESGARNLNYGDRDSKGAFQQRPSQGWGKPGSVEQDAHDYFDRAIPLRRKYGKASELAQAVQRSAFPERYQQRAGEASKLLKGSGGGSRGGTRRVSTSKTVPGMDRSEDRKQAQLSYLRERGRPGALLDLAGRLGEAQDTPARTVTSTRTVKARGKRPGRGQTDIESIIRMAEADGLTVGEHPSRGGVAPVHAPGSYHGRRAKRSPGAAADITGPPDKLARFQRKLARRYGKDLEELIYNGPGGGLNIKRGKRVGRGFYSGHTGHLHAADID